MDKDEFQKFLKRGGRSPNVIQRCLRMVDEFAAFLLEYRDGVSLEEIKQIDLEEFVSWIERDSKYSAKSYL
ncbi:MAG: hypothetical protein PVF83_15565 [Anaerolineales bacterium]